MSPILLNTEDAIGKKMQVLLLERGCSEQEGWPIGQVVLHAFHGLAGHLFLKSTDIPSLPFSCLKHRFVWKLILFCMTTRLAMQCRNTWENTKATCEWLKTAHTIGCHHQWLVLAGIIYNLYVYQFIKQSTRLYNVKNT